MDIYPRPLRRAIPSEVVHPPVLYRAATSTLDCPQPARADVTLLRAEVEFVTGRRLPLAEVVGRIVEFAAARREEFLASCAQSQPGSVAAAVKT